jgi:hypothetical protein
MMVMAKQEAEMAQRSRTSREIWRIGAAFFGGVAFIVYLALVIFVKLAFGW